MRFFFFLHTNENRLQCECRRFSHKEMSKWKWLTMECSLHPTTLNTRCRLIRGLLGGKPTMAKYLGPDEIFNT